MMKEEPLKDMTDVFTLEQEHLTEVYNKLESMEKSLESRISSIAEKAAAEKLDIRENLALNFDGDSDSMETYIEFEVMNHAIDQYNIDRDTAAEKLSHVKRLLRAPYFAKVQLQFDPDEDAEEYYIGSTGVSEDGHEPLVIDWRSPVAETYYNQDNGKTFYTVDGHRINVDLLLRRQFELSENHLHAFFDTQIAIEDPLLIRSLTRQRSDKMQAITATIQKEQNAVVRHENVPVLLVNGIAGSGKTSVLLQRIAWLFYRQRDTLRPDEVVLMTLNPIFRRYIDQVLPDMGEMNPVSVTWKEFLAMAGVSRRKGSGGSDFRTLPESLCTMEESLPSLRLEPDDLRSIHQKSIKVLSRTRIAEVLAQHPEIPTGERLVQIVIDDLKEIAKHEIRRKERDEEEMRENADENSSGAESSRPADGPGSRAEDNRIQSQYGGAFQAINSCQWLDIDRIGARLLGRKKLSDLEWLYLKMLLTGQRDLRTKYVMVDEVQDYTPAQLMVLRRYYPRARFMLLGDEYQAIREGTVTFAQIHEMFNTVPADSAAGQAGLRRLSARIGSPGSASSADSGRPQPLRRAASAAAGKRSPASKSNRVTELFLTTSYRSSPEITALFAGLLPAEQQILVSSVQPSGYAPEFSVCKAKEEYAQALVAAVQKAEQQEGLTAIVCVGARSMEKTAALLIEYMAEGSALPAAGSSAGSSTDNSANNSADNTAGMNAAGSDLSDSGSLSGVDLLRSCPVPVIRSGGSLPEKGVFLITLAHAKGLEFDGVLLPDANADNYPDTLLARHRLYTALSRATRRLAVLARGSLTPLLQDKNDQDKQN